MRETAASSGKADWRKFRKDSTETAGAKTFSSRQAPTGEDAGSPHSSGECARAPAVRMNDGVKTADYSSLIHKLSHTKETEEEEKRKIRNHPLLAEKETFKMEEGYELDLTYITERIIAVSFPRGCSDETYSHNLKDVTRMLKSKHADNYLTINLSERRHDLSKMNPKTLDTGWPDMHAPPLDKICTICKAMESWLNADPLHVVVIHCRGGKGRIGVVISSFVHFTDVSASADQALDRFAMRKYYDDKVSALMTPSQKRYVWILNSLLSGSMKINASPSFLHCVILHGIPNFDATRVCRPYIKVYQGMQAVYSSGVYHIGPGHRDRVCIALEPAQLLKGDIMIKCYHKSEVTSEREVVFRLQFHTGAVQGYNLMFEKEDMEVANKDPRFPDYGKVELVFSEGPEKIPGADRWQNGPDVVVDYNTSDPLTRWDSYQNICDGEDVESSNGPESVTRNPGCQGSDLIDHPGFYNPGWGKTEDFGSHQTYSPCVPHSQHSVLYRGDTVEYRDPCPDIDNVIETGQDMTPPTPAFPISPPTPYVKNMPELADFRQIPSPVQSYGGFSTNHEPRGYSEINGVGGENFPDSTTNCHRTLMSTFFAHQPIDSRNQSWPEHPPLSRHSSLSSYPPARQPLQHSMSIDYSHKPAPAHHLHMHPIPNSHSSPRSNQRSRMAFYALSRGAAQAFEEQDDSVQCYGTNCPSMAVNRDPLTSTEAQNRSQTPQMQPPLLPEKKRASDGDHSLGTASPALSGFSSPHSGSSLSIPFPNILPDLSVQPPHTTSPLPDVLASKQVTVKFVQDTSKFWYKPDISRDQAISVLKDKEPGSFIVRDSHSFKGAYGLAMKVATPPPTVVQQGKKGGDFSNELVRHFLIECTQKGVRLKGCPNEPYFGSLTALVCQHSITPLALPCKLIIPDRDPLEDEVENPAHSVTNSAAELLKQGAACNVWYLSSVEMESLTGTQAVQKATTMTLNLNPPPTSTVVHFKVSSQGITLTDNQRKLFFRRHYSVNTVIFCALDPQDRKWKKDGCPSAKIFGFVARKTGTSMDNICHLFAEHDPEQPASAIVNFVSKVMIGSQRSK
ncbi:tensin-3 isoform X3 [Oryzias melastigma]|uniref:Tensin 3 n=1 Tax=Oryzias melastigma TaxID=30732 RepID=A0A3B3D234_ORYME|nr:tensin-3 isoform X3 [Oryzias melastigma]